MYCHVVCKGWDCSPQRSSELPRLSRVFRTVNHDMGRMLSSAVHSSLKNGHIGEGCIVLACNYTKGTELEIAYDRHWLCHGMFQPQLWRPLG